MGRELESALHGFCPNSHRNLRKQIFSSSEVKLLALSVRSGAQGRWRCGLKQMVLFYASAHQAVVSSAPSMCQTWHCP